jgi:ankyrin repeat protein
MTGIDNEKVALTVKAAKECDGAQVDADRVLYPSMEFLAVVVESEMLTLLHLYAKHGCRDELKTYIDAGVDPDMVDKIILYDTGEAADHTWIDDTGNDAHMTPLMYAAASDYLEIVDDLIAAGADVNKSTGLLYYEKDVLMFAAKNGSETVITSLLDAGANNTYTDAIGRTAIDHAIAGEHITIADEISEFDMT